MSQLTPVDTIIGTGRFQDVWKIQFLPLFTSFSSTTCFILSIYSLDTTSRTRIKV